MVGWWSGYCVCGGGGGLSSVCGLCVCGGVGVCL